MPARPTPAGSRARLALAAAVLACGVAFLAVRSRLAPPTRTVTRPSVVLVTIDTLRADHLGCYGDKDAATPVLDALAARGVRFATAVAQVPLTTPSHASILTGLTPLGHGVRDNGAFVLPPGVPALAEVFHRAGYRTAAFVSGFPLDRRFGLARGFDVYDDHFPRGNDPGRAAYVERTADRTTDAALEWLRAPARGAPFLLWVHYFDPHAPYEPPADLAERFRDRPYDGEIAFVDQQLGRLLAALGAEDLVLVTADHGESLGEHGEPTHGVFVYDATIRIPLIVAGPGIGPAVSPVVARSIDVAPTLLDLAGLPGPRVEGRSLRPALDGRGMPDEPAYSESLFSSLNLGWAPLHALRTARWKYVDAPRPELYALDADPGETADRAAREPEVLAGLADRLRARLQRARTPDAKAETGAEAAERLWALGYLGAGAAPAERQGPLRDPKDGIGLINRLEQGRALAGVRPAEAIRELRAVLTEDPEIPLARRALALARLASGDPRGASDELRALEARGQASFPDLVLLGDALTQAGRPQDALAVLARAAGREPDSPEPALAEARALLALGRTGEAAKRYEEVLAVRPKQVEALRGLGDLALARGDVDGASARFEAVLAIDGDDVPARLRLGVIRMRSGRAEDAVTLFREAVGRDPDNPEALLDLGGALARSGRPAEAVPFLARAVERGAKTPVAWNALGFARLEAGDEKGALAALEASLALDPRQPPVAEAVAALRSGRRVEIGGGTPRRTP